MPNEVFVLILKEKKDSGRAIPILIGLNEARCIVMEQSKAASKRPGTHELVGKVISAARFELQKVVIHHYEEGIFYANLILRDPDQNVFEIDSRTSDAVILALKFNIPIYIKDTILSKAAIFPTSVIQPEDFNAKKKELNEDMEAYNQFLDEKLRNMNKTELNNLLQGAVECEDYELASKIHEELTRRKDSR
ncbi:MAG: bifunctional nuclease family protein [Bacteroidales bacterium]|nr:bifunctional nuclease family protein [Bacteroidales bacterium]